MVIQPDDRPLTPSDSLGIRRDDFALVGFG